MSDFADLQRTLRKLALVPSQVAAEASKGIARQIDYQFDAGVDPYGKPWAPLMDSTVARGRSAPPLTDTGALRDSVDVHPQAGAGIAVTFDDPGVHHQYGTVNMDARPIFPNRGMPDTWQREISDAADAAFDRAQGGGRE